MLKLTNLNLTSATEKATKLRPWIKSLGNGLYRVARRPTDKDQGWRPHFVQLALAGREVLIDCDCDGFRFERSCYHVARVCQHLEKRLRTERWCPQCRRNWLAETYAGNGSMPYVQKCEECETQIAKDFPRLSHACQHTNHNHCDGRGDCPCKCHGTPIHLLNPAVSFVQEAG